MEQTAEKVECKQQSDTKQFKDPIYGYIEIDVDIVCKIIDTPTFQRLKDIRQTSYTPLFPAAYHNRFVHSLGVYHLGKMAFQSIKPQLEKESVGTKIEGKVDSIQDVFELACLLHDVGHAPFSHTGEAFFVDKAKTLDRELKSTVGDPDFIADFDELGTNLPAPHERMSCVVGLKAFPECFPTSEARNLFARCIIGLPIRVKGKAPGKGEKHMSGSEQAERKAYKEKKKEVELINCVIGLLNSSIIDVDRLDYIIRDAETIGFKNAQVDYMRLLKGMRILHYQDKWQIGYHKSALSVIESAVYAHDAEKKWVQSHPAIIYEMEVLKNAIGFLTSKFKTEEDPNPLFCYNALTEEGKTLTVTNSLLSDEAREICAQDGILSDAAKECLKKDVLFANADNIEIDINRLTVSEKYSVSLLADEDLLHFIKRFCKDSLGYEYFARNKRRVAAWKSEAEFRALFQKRIGDGSDSMKRLEESLAGLVEFCQEKSGMPIINEKIYAYLNAERAEAERAKNAQEIDQDYYDDIIHAVNDNEYWAKLLEETANKLELQFDFLVVSQKKFSSSFRADLDNIPILFPNIEGDVAPLSLSGVLKSDLNRKSNFFHIYYQPKDSMDREKKKKVVQTLAKNLIAGVIHAP